ncbi:hypothetical protein M0R88_00855 [Halorussus gelatinilyticus]|uniref:Yip1 domain-containing protein n=1 Tax=Halorussus gelatinilyticus TaxID=2937524 RepID=A0A8U0IHV6_9EURY|nr:hypothetical protein [Halorussus gelatinilyticus]UPW00667.1 hypothetical protein M0R88_00855 [Halorussus gelatinilyticus]
MDDHLRRGLPFFLTVGLPAAGGLDWYARTGCEDCYGAGLPLTLAGYLLALAAAVCFAALASWLLGEAIERALDWRVGRAVFAPSGRTLAALVPVVGVALALARPLFAGQTTADPAVWSLLAVLYAPFVAGLFPAFALLTAVESGQQGVALFVALVGCLLAASLAEVAWLYLLATGLGRVAAGVGQRVASTRNSWSE